MKSINPVGKIKRKLIFQLIIGLLSIIIAASAVYIIVLKRIPLNVMSQDAPLIYLIFAGVVAFILAAHLFRTLRGYFGMNRLVSTLEQLATSHSLQYKPESESHALSIYRPIVGSLKGKLNGKQVSIFPALDYAGRQNSQPKRITVFEAELLSEWPAFSLQKKSFFGNIFKGLLGGIELKGDFLIFPQAGQKKSKEELLSEVQKAMPEDTLYDFQNLSGKNEMLVKGGLFSLSHSGFIADINEYSPFLNLLSKLK